jgi:hypothetical protein
MVRLKRIPAIRAANVLTLTIAIPALALQLFFYLLLFPAGTSGIEMAGNLGAVLAAFAFALVWTWITIAVACGLYNLIAGRLGGIELEFTTVPPRT